MARVGAREETRHPDGHPDPLLGDPPDDRRDDPGRAIGKVKEVHSWSGKHWGDRNPRPDRKDPVPAGLNWDVWLGVAGRAAVHRPLLPPRRVAEAARLRHRHVRRHGLPHPRPRVRVAGPGRPRSVRSEGGAPNADNWGLDSQVHLHVPGHQVHHRALDPPLVRRRCPAPRRDQGPDRQAGSARPGVDLHRRRRASCMPRTSTTPCSCRPRSSRA